MNNQIKKNLFYNMFQGRLCRKNYFYGIIALWLLIIPIAIILWFIFKIIGLFFDIETIILFYIILFLLIVLFNLSLVIKRHHDLNQKRLYPFFILTSIFIIGLIHDFLVGPIGGLYTLYLFFAKGSECDNNFGSPDKQKGILQIIGTKS